MIAWALDAAVLSAAAICAHSLGGWEAAVIVYCGYAIIRWPTSD